MPERNGVARRPLVALEALTSFVALAARYRAWHLAWGIISRGDLAISDPSSWPVSLAAITLSRSDKPTG